MAKTKKPRQKHLPGLKPPSIPALDEAAETYYEVMIERCKLSKDEDAAKDNLIDRMKQHDVERYETPDGLVVTLTSKSNVRAKRKNVEENGEADEE